MGVESYLKNLVFYIICPGLLAIFGFIAAFKTKAFQDFRAQMMFRAADPNSKLDYWIFKVIGHELFAVGSIVVLGGITIFIGELL